MLNQASTCSTNDLTSQKPTSEIRKAVDTKFGFNQTRFSRITSLPSLKSRHNVTLANFSVKKKKLTNTHNAKFFSNTMTPVSTD